MIFSRDQICAHRGASGHYPENTRAAFDAAAQSGAGWIETDIQCLADGELVIFHDEQLGRTATGSARLRDLCWSEVAPLDIGSWKGAEFSTQRPLRCEDLIEWQSGATDRPGIVWEMKCSEDPEAVEAAAQALIERLSVAQDHRCIVSSFSRAVLQAIRPRLPAVPMALIAGALPADGIAFCLNNALEGIHLDGQDLHEAAAHMILAAGLSLRSYTVNTEAEARRLSALGVSMIMTDFPERLLTTP